jgi:hypothetical protein
MMEGWTKFVVAGLLLCSCHRGNNRKPDGLAVETQLLSDYHLSKDYSDVTLLEEVINDINCADSVVLGKKIKLAASFHSWDTTQILLIPFISNGALFKSSAYSDVHNRFILINPSYIRAFTLKNTLNDSISHAPILKLMLLHEVGHFILHRSGSFDEIESTTQTGEQVHDPSQPEFLTTIKKIELSADSLAIDLIKRKLNGRDYNCLAVAFDIQRIVPGMQFQMAGMRMIENFGSNTIHYLYDPSKDHPNLELRITFMNYFLYPSDSLRQMIDGYLYNRTVAPVHRQEFDPRIFQIQEKKLPGN